MSVMIEVEYRLPADERREERLLAEVAVFGGTFDSRQETNTQVQRNVSLIYEFADWDCAEKAAERLRSIGEHVDGPCSYGPD